MRTINTVSLRYLVSAFVLSVQACANASVYINENKIPQVKVDNIEVEKVINKNLSEYFSDFSCDDGTRPDMMIESQYVSSNYISASYIIAGYCSGNASPFEYSGGFTYDLKSGAGVRLEQLISDKNLVDDAIKVAYKKVKENYDCPSPDYGGEFFIKENIIVLKEFYPEKQFVTCEFFVELPLN